MSFRHARGAGALLRHRSFLLFLLSRSLSRFSSLIGIVAIGWQVYELTGSAFDLGMVGLVGFSRRRCWCSSRATRRIVTSASGSCRSASWPRR